LSAVAAPKISSNTSRAFASACNCFLRHAGFSRSALWELGLRFIQLAFVGLRRHD
jgi:hypothetical protein